MIKIYKYKFFILSILSNNIILDIIITINTGALSNEYDTKKYPCIINEIAKIIDVAIPNFSFNNFINHTNNITKTSNKIFLI